MKKICILFVFLFIINSFVFARGYYTANSEERKLNQDDKIFYAFTGYTKLMIGSWGFRQKYNSYGIFTGILFCISGIRDLYLAIRKEEIIK